MWWRDVAPARCISRMTGSTLAAWRSASALIDAAAASRASVNLGPPSFTPRALAAAKAALVRVANRHVEADELNTIVGLRWGPEVPDVQDTVSCVCTAAIHLIVLISEFCGFHDLQNRLGGCWADYKKLIEAQSREADIGPARFSDCKKQ
jgi:hypothetical protein